MTNALTGDFEAVLQVSGDTVNRLLATMHQNSIDQPELPTFPHSMSMRIGDGHAIDGVKGFVQVQVSMPRVELIDGATDRFVLEVGVRAWYRPDPRTTPLPAFIQGTVRAEYRIQDIDPHCLGWERHAADYLWFRVVKDSVRFEGNVAEDLGLLDGLGIISTTDEASDLAKIAKVTKQIAGLLATRFRAMPHPVTNRFKRGSMRSLNPPEAGSAVAIPILLSDDPSLDPAGDIASVDSIFLDGTDVAVGVSVEYVLSIVNAKLAAIAQFRATVAVSVETPITDFDTVYHLAVNTPVVTWAPQGSFALFNIKVHGSASTRSTVFPNATLDVSQDIRLEYAAGDGKLHLTPGALRVSVSADGFGAAQLTAAATPLVTKEVQSLVATACSEAQAELDVMPARTQLLTNQLGQLDKLASVQLEDAEFVPAGIVLRGSIALSPRKRPIVQFKQATDKDGFTALESWLPGGRIDTFEWSWSWFGASPAPPGNAALDHRFLLRRPKATMGRWGVGLGATVPLPGIDGWGKVCLRIKGVQVDAVTGRRVHVESFVQCARFGLNLSDRLRADSRLLFRGVSAPSRGSHEAPSSELALVRAGGGHVASTAANTLLVYAGETWDPKTAHALKAGLERCRRYDAGLALLVLFQDGTLAGNGHALQGRVEHFASELGIAAFVNEDVSGAWSHAFSLPSGLASTGLRLITPEGVVAWRHDGPIASETLSTALDIHLRASPHQSPVPLQSDSLVGRPVSAATLDPARFDDLEAACPPIPLERLGLSDRVVGFVHGGSASSAAHVRALVQRHRQANGKDTSLVIVVDGANARVAAALKQESGVDFVAVPDPSGAISDRLGVGIWPTTITIDGAGKISAVVSGV